MRHRPSPRPRSLAGQLFAMQVVLVAVRRGRVRAVHVRQRPAARPRTRPRRQAMAAARAVADSPSVREAIATPRPHGAAPAVRGAGACATPGRLRHDHGPGRASAGPTPTRTQIGERFLGHIGPRAARADLHRDLHRHARPVGPGRSPRSRRRRPDRRPGQRGHHGRGDQHSRCSGQLSALLGVAGGALALGGVGTYVINARLRRHTHGMNAAELSRMHDYHEAALHAVREGLLMLDGQRRVALINDGGRELLGAGRRGRGRPVGRRARPARPADGRAAGRRAAGGRGASDGGPGAGRQHLPGVRRRAARHGGDAARPHRTPGADRASWTPSAASPQALRSQAHEAANRLHTVVSLIELGRAEEAVDFATAELELAQALTDQVVAAVERAGARRAAAGQGGAGQRAGRGAGGRRRTAASTTACSRRPLPRPRPGDDPRQPDRQRGGRGPGQRRARG